MPSILRSIGAVVLGFVAIGALAFGTQKLIAPMLPAGSFDAMGNPLTSPLQLATLAYVAVYATFGCWLAGRLAPSAPMKHALALGVLGLVFNVATSMPFWKTMPAWYLVVGIGTTMLWAWLGGRLAERSSGPRAITATA